MRITIFVTNNVRHSPVLSTIDLDDQALSQTYKIENKPITGDLATKVKSVRAP